MYGAHRQVRRAQASRARAGRGGQLLLLLSKKHFSIRVSALRRKSQLLLPNIEKTNLVKYKIYLMVQPKLKWDHAASSIIADH